MSGLLRLTVSREPSFCWPPVVIAIDRSSRAMSPRSTEGSDTRPVWLPTVHEHGLGCIVCAVASDEVIDFEHGAASVECLPPEDAAIGTCVRYCAAEQEGTHSCPSVQSP